MKRAKKDPKAWRSTSQARVDYQRARTEAQAKANEYGFDYGIEANDVFKQWHVFMLPMKKNRYGHECFCEVVSCEVLDRCQPGHGPMAGG